MSETRDSIYINDYLSFNPEYGMFEVSLKAQEILYRQKQVICSYSGCVEWGHKFFCELLDLYSGDSQYNYALGTVVHKDQIEKLYKDGKQDRVIDWVERHKDDYWFAKAAAMLAEIIKDVPEVS